MIMLVSCAIIVKMPRFEVPVHSDFHRASIAAYRSVLC